MLSQNSTLQNISAFFWGSVLVALGFLVLIAYLASVKDYIRAEFGSAKLRFKLEAKNGTPEKDEELGSATSTTGWGRKV